VFFEIIRELSIKDTNPRIVNSIESHDWRAEIMAYLRGHYEPQDELEEKRLRQMARGYVVVIGELYKSTKVGDGFGWAIVDNSRKLQVRSSGC
jgi:hypothetical protein